MTAFTLFVSMIILLPILFFPIATDTAIFIQAGKIIANGGVPYVDFIDIKPPIIYYIYAFICNIFGSSEFGIHLFDYMIQLLTAFLLYKLVSKYTLSKSTAFWSTIVYSIIYTVLGHNQTMQVESYVPILTMGMITLSLNDDRKYLKIFLVGILAGFITGLKFTMGVIIFYQLFFDILSGERRMGVLLRRSLFFVSGFVLSAFISFIPLIVYPSAREGFQNVYYYLSIYSQSTIFGNVLRDSLKAVAEIFGDKLSLLLTITIFLGLSRSLKVSDKEDNTNKMNSSSFIILILLSISVMIEKKYFLYHFSRLFSVYSIYAGIGLTYIIRTFNSNWKNSLLNKGIIVSTLVFLLLLSPVPRWINLLAPSYYFLTDKQSYYNYYNREDTQAILLKEHKTVADFAKSNTKPGEKVMVISIASSIINYYIGERADTKYLLSCFYINSIEIPLWRSEAFSDLSHATILVMQTNDPTPIANGHAFTSYEYMMTSSFFSDYIKSSFIPVFDTPHFRIYHRKV